MKKVVANISGIFILLLGIGMIILPLFKLFGESSQTRRDVCGLPEPTVYIVGFILLEIFGFLLLRSAINWLKGTSVK
jgi:hypothetical protein